MHLDNLKIRTKLLVIYMACVLLPMLLTDALILGLVLKSAGREQNSAMRDSGERIAYEMNRRVNDALSVSDYLYRDKDLNEFLRESYQDETEYYENFNRLMENNVIRYYYTAQSVYGITICTDNKTITNGSYFQKKEDLSGREWYQDYQNSGESSYVCASYEEENPYLVYTDNARTVSIIRKMDYNGGADLLKLDLDYGGLEESIRNEAGNGEIYLHDQERVICSTGDGRDGGEDFMPLSEMELQKVQVRREIELPGAQWELVVTAAPYSLWKGLSGQGLTAALLVAVNLILPSMVILSVNRSFRDRVALTGEHLQKLEQGKFEEIRCREGSDEIGSLIRSYNLMIVKIRELIGDICRETGEKQAAQLARKQAELNALQSQVNPHFMFNTLESIRMRSLVKGEEETARIMEQFASLLRKATRWDEDLVKISDEAANVEAYLEIQKYRFGEKLSYSVYIQEQCADKKIPKFGLLNLVENACVHGVERRVDGGSVTVAVTGDEKSIYLEVMDSGGGMEAGELENLQRAVREAAMERLEQSSSIGILNTVVRLRLYYGETVEFEINSEQGEGTEVCVTIPSGPGKDQERVRKGSV